ncbi:hypothetical protein QO010_004759 [Caulobacter ginsengisoli]|uniref:Uncharacterized protein n=1 Tax=Caulobacter ginsengisoli TaxID=400775 RepID=A0ABU0IY78_9CAUL|nr:DUF6386 family protein [Caulobacter ginsengisoli]MDQ0466962.1 hypothetical protein [Caulobacter ginsengisoli]
MIRNLTVTTDTATICIYDVPALAHRKDDVGDWWSIPARELEEVNNGNVLFLNLGCDGTYAVDITVEESVGLEAFELNAPSGRLFVGPGELVSGGGLEPDDAWGGTFIDLPPGHYRCSPMRTGNQISIRLAPGGVGRNALTDLIRL